MAPIFPLAKLAFLFVKQVARPLSSSIRRRAVTSVFFREYFCLPPARLYHWCEVRMKMYVMNIGPSSESSTIPKLNEEAAIELGANLLGEGVIFGLAVAILAFEMSRQKEKEIKKEEMIDTLQNQVKKHDAMLRETTKLLVQYATLHEIKQKQGNATLTAKVRDPTVNVTASGTVMKAVTDAKSRVVNPSNVLY